MPDFQPTVEQHAIIHHGKGHAFVNAVPGSGKTRTMVSRVEHLLNLGVDPKKVLVLMFNVAAKDHFQETLNSRIRKPSPQIVTFDALAYQITQSFMNKAYLPKRRLVTNNWQMDYIIKESFKICTSDHARNITKRIQTAKLFIDRVKSECLTTDSQKQNFSEELDNVELVQVYQEYERIRLNSDIQFFVDLSHDLLNLYPVIGERAADIPSYDVILVDEAQDLTPLNLSLLKWIAKEADIMAVGDPDQTVYAFRGADPTIISEAFAQHFPGAEHYNLSKTFRFGQNVSYISNNLMAHEKGRQPKEIQSAKTTPDTTVVLVKDTHTHFLDEIKRIRQSDNNEQSIAILFRVFASSLPYQIQLLRHNIPYRLEGGEFLFDVKEIDVLIAYLELYVYHRHQHQDTHLLKSILKRLLLFPILYLKKEEQEHLEDLLIRKPIDEWPMIIQRYSTLRSWVSTQQRLNALSHAIAIIISSPNVAQQILNEVASTLNWSDHLNHQSMSADENAIASSIIDTLSDLVSRKPISVESFIHDVEQQKRAFHNIYSSTHNPILVTSVHRSKGREFHSVFMPSLREGTFPCYRENEPITEDIIKDERRLFFVGVTRAIENLILFAPDPINTQSNSPYQKNTRFLNECMTPQYLNNPSG